MDPAAVCCTHWALHDMDHPFFPGVCSDTLAVAVMLKANRHAQSTPNLVALSTTP